MSDANWSVQDDGTAIVQGNLGSDDVDLAIDLSGSDVWVELGEGAAYFNVFDLLEAVIYQAYAVDVEKTAQILGEAVLGSVGSSEYVPEHGWMGSNDG